VIFVTRDDSRHRATKLEPIRSVHTSRDIAQKLCCFLSLHLNRPFKPTRFLRLQKEPSLFLFEVGLDREYENSFFPRFVRKCVGPGSSTLRLFCWHAIQTSSRSLKKRGVWDRLGDSWNVWSLPGSMLRALFSAIWANFSRKNWRLSYFSNFG
jgi:hypothetical protein